MPLRYTSGNFGDIKYLKRERGSKGAGYVRRKMHFIIAHVRKNFFFLWKKKRDTPIFDCMQYRVTFICLVLIEHLGLECG